MSEILVSPTELRDHGLAVKNQAISATADFQAMKSRLEALSGQFKGKAAIAFDARWQEWHTGAQGLIEGLDGLATFLQSAADTVEGVDEQLASGLKG